MQPIETINLDLSVPQGAVELVKSGGDNSCCYELRFQICTRRSCRITLYLQAIENLSKNSAVDNSQHSLLEYGSVLFIMQQIYKHKTDSRL
jgi:hypothetical protein